MKRLIIFLLLINQMAFGQNDILDQLTRKAPNCETISFNAAELISRLYGGGKFDSIALVAREWEHNCGMSEPLFRLKVLLSIQNGTFSDELMADEPILGWVQNYESRLQVSKEKNFRQIYEYYKISFGFVPVNSDFDTFTALWSDTLLDDVKTNENERLWCYLYSNQPELFYEYLRRNQYPDTEVQRSYNNATERARRMWDGNLGFITGLALPTGNLANVIGPKSLWGFQIGARHLKMQYDLTIALRPGSPKQDYTVLYQGATILTDHYLGGYIGADLAYEALRRNKTELNVIAGIGFDGFDAVEGNTEKDIQGKSINSLNINAGAGIRFYILKSGYLGMQLRYNLVNYRNPQGTGLDGNYISFLLTYNLFGNITKKNLLKQLHQN
jgi:hypothetical protein